MSDEKRPAAPTTQRVLALLDLLQRRTTWTGPELAEELGVTTRCIRRDVDRLRDLGYPVDAERGAGGGYRLGPGRRLPPLLLDDREAVAVALALRLAAGAAVADVGEHALSALAKLDQVMPPRLAERVTAVVESTTTVSGPGDVVDPALLLDLGRAVRDAERIRFDYTDRTGAASERRVEPYRMVALGRRWYLLAHDVDREDWRTFRLDRIGAVHHTGWRFTRRTDVPEPATHVQRGVTSAQYTHRARVRVAAGADVVAERFPPQYAVVTPVRGEDEPGGPECLVEAGAENPDVLAWYLASIPADFVVESPADVAERVRVLGERLVAATRAHPGPGAAAD